MINKYLIIFYFSALLFFFLIQVHLSIHSSTHCAYYSFSHETHIVFQKNISKSKRSQHNTLTHTQNKTIHLQKKKKKYGRTNRRQIIIHIHKLSIHYFTTDTIIHQNKYKHFSFVTQYMPVCSQNLCTSIQNKTTTTSYSKNFELAQEESFKLLYTIKLYRLLYLQFTVRKHTGCL